MNQLLKGLITLGLILTMVPAIAQDDAKADDKKADAAETTGVDTTETEEQKNTRTISLRDLREADEKINQEREAIMKRERRIAQLLEDLTNRTQSIESKEADIQKKLEEKIKAESTAEVPNNQVVHWEKRNPATAAKDFIILFDANPQVAVAIVKAMKEKKSARLIDEVNKLGTNGRKIAAEVHEAIGTGRLDKQ